ncbi:hypothetical protein HYDPIDRAFT_37273 [Hydnomerulius pinastri MD-312]|nr:hypothetical protein HYDPIDRAFT_37273 [Hydnomerulius pinastri MD-312]
MSDDFFTSVPFGGQSTNQGESVDSFAHAIAVRFGSADLLTARLLPGELHHSNTVQPDSHPPNHHAQQSSLPAPVLPSMSLPPTRTQQVGPTGGATGQAQRIAGTQDFTPVPPSALNAYLSHPSTLILDIRPHAAHASGRIRHSLSLSVPSTLLKRPLFSLSKLAQMLPSHSARARFAAWSNADRILVYDADSVLTPDNSNICGLLRKFRAEGFAGELGWVRGGFQAVWREARELATTEPPSPDEDESEVVGSSVGALRTKHLPKAAFSLSSTTSGAGVGSVGRGMDIPQTPAPTISRAANPFFDAIRQNVELSQGITERIPLRLPRHVRKRINDLPFRWLQDIARRSAVRHSGSSSRSSGSGVPGMESESESSDDLHTSDPDENDPDVEEGTEALAMQFYRIELAEQRRLRTVMEHHSKESEVAGAAATGKPYTVLEGGGVGTVGGDPADSGRGVVGGAKTAPGTPHPGAFPFSITAGVEKGAKNRYAHIWPFEHARVRLHDGQHQGSHPGKGHKGKAAGRGGSSAKDRAKDRAEEKDKESNRSSPHFSGANREMAEAPGVSRHSIDFDTRMSAVSERGDDAEPSREGVTPEVEDQAPGPPQLKLDHQALGFEDQDSRMSDPPTPATTFRLPLTPYPAQTPMDISPAPTPMRAQPPQMLPPPGPSTSASAIGNHGGTQFALPASSLPSLDPLPSFTLRLPSRAIGGWPGIGTIAPTPASSSGFHMSLSSIPQGAVGVAISGPRIEAGAGIKVLPPRQTSPPDDYVNASYVQPLGTQKRYIATQGPLPATFVDFWTLVWEQNVHVIVMLTREVENSMVKCGTYWTATTYGPLELKLLSTSPPTSPSASSATDNSNAGFFFAPREPPATSSGGKDRPSIITWTFSLSHTSYPGVPPRRITHLQYLDWPDMNVPEDPRGILDLVRRVDKAVAESSPGPSPSVSGSSSNSGSLSPDSGSVSASPSPGIGSGSEVGGLDKSFFAPFRAVTREGKRKRGSGWRHPELDPRTGVAAFALSRAAPVLLHCSAGVGRTGGFIAVDAVLDAVKRELRKRREGVAVKRDVGAGTNTRVGMYTGIKASGVDGSGGKSAETVASGVASGGGESTSGEGEGGGMDVDKPTAHSLENAQVQNQSQILGTVPLHVSAGDNKKGRRAHHSKDPSSSESLVVHVPLAGTDDASKAGNTADMQLNDPTNAGWQSSSTRGWAEWAEQVSDQTHTLPGEEQLSPTPIDVGRERSPGSSSSSSAPSALNSVDDSVGGSSRSGSGSGAERKSATGSSSGLSGSGVSGSGSGAAPPPSVSPSNLGSGSGSISASRSGTGSGTGSGSRFGSSSGIESLNFMGLMRARLQDSSATSVSNASTDSLSPEKAFKVPLPLRQPSATHVGPGAPTGSDMDVDRPPRSISVPLQPTGPPSNVANLQPSIYQRRQASNKPTLGSAPAASFSSPALATSGRSSNGVSFFDVDTAGEPELKASSDPSSDELMSPVHDSESGGSADAEQSRNGSGKSSQVSPDESEENVSSGSHEISPNTNSGPSSGKDKETLNTSSTAKDAPVVKDAKGKGKAGPIPTPMPRVSGASESPPSSSSVTNLGTLEVDQRTAGHSVIDYKLPRELHTNVSPPLISSYIDPIWMVVEDMREQRMSLCQSLRQYVFVHAAVIEGALRIVDEEREFWGDSGGSDDGSPPDIDLHEGERKPDDGEVQKAWFRSLKSAELAAMGQSQGGIRDRARSFPAVSYAAGTRSLGSSSQSSHLPPTTASSSSGASSSPSKGKRGPSPTELPKEDKTGALSLNKRPSTKQESHRDDGIQSAFDSGGPPTSIGGSGGASREAGMSASATRSKRGLLAPGKGGLSGHAK